MEKTNGLTPSADGIAKHEAYNKNAGWILYTEKDGVFTITEHGRYICAMLGMEPEGKNTACVKGKDLISFIPWFARERFINELHALKIGDNPKTLVHPYIKQSGKIADAETKVTLVSQTDDSKVYGAVYEDAIEKKIASLRTKTEQLISVFRYVYDEIGILDFSKDSFIDASASPEIVPENKKERSITQTVDFFEKNFWSEEEKRIWQIVLRKVRNKQLYIELPGYPAYIRFFNYKEQALLQYKVRIVPIEGDLYLFLARKVLTEADDTQNDDKTDKEAEPHKRMYPAPDTPLTVTVRTFGYFDVFVGGQAVSFGSAKAKELLAVLIDRRGGYVSSKDAISLLWEDAPADATTLARYRKVAMRLRQILESNGIAGIMETKNGNRRINPDTVRCDLYDFLSDDPAYADSYNGRYMCNYSWGEETLADLERKANK